MSHDVLIFGASCRAAAFSALRAGLRPRCADYFADRDLAAICHVDRIDSRQPRREFTALAESLPASRWFYTGGFENHPAWVEQIARKHRLWGAGGSRFARCVIRFASLLCSQEQGIPSLAVRRDPLGLPRDGSWLMKPLRSGGGRDIRPLTADVDQLSGPVYFQERIDGPSFSALYIGEPDGSRLVGVTQQLLGAAGSPFAYRGSIGPWPIGEGLAIKLRTLGEVLAQAFGVTGLVRRRLRSSRRRFRGRSRSTRAIRRRSRFTSSPWAERSFATIGSRARAWATGDAQRCQRHPSRNGRGSSPS